MLLRLLLIKSLSVNYQKNNLLSTKYLDTMPDNLIIMVTNNNTTLQFARQRFLPDTE